MATAVVWQGGFIERMGALGALNLTVDAIGLVLLVKPIKFVQYFVLKSLTCVSSKRAGLSATHPNIL